MSGLGLSLVSGPLLVAAIGPHDGVRLSMTLSIVLNAVLLVRLHRHVDRRSAALLLVPAALATVLLARLARRLPERPAAALVGAVVVLAALLLASGVRVRAARGRTGAVLAGLASAGTNVVAGVAGPAVALWAADVEWEATSQRATLQACFLGLNLVALPSLGPPRVGGALLAGCLGSLVIGVVLGAQVARRVSALAARRATLAQPIAALRPWDYRWDAQSIPQSLAMFWGDALQPKLPRVEGEPRNRSIARLGGHTTPGQKLDALAEAVARLQREFGDWRVPWGQINRFQRISPAIDHPFSDAASSIPVPFASGVWGSLASFGSAPKPGTRTWYGTSGNSFVAAVEFGPQVRAIAITVGGESGDPSSPHFTDQAQRYASGALRAVYLTADQLKQHTQRTYRPGQ